MKQNISMEDLNSLSDKGKERLSKWWKPSEGQLWTLIENLPNGSYFHTQFGDSLEMLKQNKGMLPLLSIGQRIEFLGEQKYRSWWDGIIGEDRDGLYKLYGGELCDALWEACLEILNYEKESIY